MNKRNIRDEVQKPLHQRQRTMKPPPVVVLVQLVVSSLHFHSTAKNIYYNYNRHYNFRNRRNSSCKNNTMNISAIRKSSSEQILQAINTVSSGINVSEKASRLTTMYHCPSWGNNILSLIYWATFSPKISIL